MTDGSGRTTTELFQSPEFHRTSQGWKPLSGRLTRTTNGELKVADVAVPTTFLRAGQLTLETSSGPLTMTLPGARAVLPRAEDAEHGADAQLRYSELVPHVDAIYGMSGSSIKERLVLKNSAAPRSFDFELSDPGHSLGTPAVDSSGRIAFAGHVAEDTGLVLAAPSAWDSHADGPEKGVVTAHQSIRRTPRGWAITIGVDREWLKGKSYPITLDPTMVYSAADQTMTGSWTCGWMSFNEDGSPHTCPIVGTVDGSAYIGGPQVDPDDRNTKDMEGYWRFDMSQFLPGTKIDSARFELSIADDVGARDVVFPSYVSPENSAVPNWPDYDFLSRADLEVEAGQPTSGVVRQQADVTTEIQAIVDKASGADAGLVLHTFCEEVTVNPRTWRGTCAKQENQSGNGFFASPDGRWATNPVLTITYSGRPLPPPVKLEQTFGCECILGSTASQTRSDADPVDTASGAFSESATDVSVATASADLVMERSYNSADATSGSMGRGWSVPFDAHLTEDTSSGDVTMVDPSGAEALFHRLGDGSYLGDTGISARLIQHPSGWVLQESSGGSLKFDIGGRLTSSAAADGGETSFDRSPSGAVTAISSGGRSLTLVYGSSGVDAGKLVTVIAPDGSRVSYEYATSSAGPVLSRIVNQAGEATSLSHDAQGRITSIANANGRPLTSNEYGPDGRVLKQTDMNGGHWSFGWAPSRDDAPPGSGRATITSPTGRTSVDYYWGHVLLSRKAEPVRVTGSGGFSLPPGVETRYYDANLNVTGVRDGRGNVTTMSYDARGNVLSRTAPAPVSTVERWTYDAAGRPLSYKDAAGATTSNTYDALGHLTSVKDALGRITRFEYSPQGFLTARVSPRGARFTFAYDQTGNVITETSSEGRVTSHSYDDVGRRISTTAPRGNVAGANAAQFTIRTTYDALGRVVTSADLRGNTTTNTYDAAGDLIDQRTTSSSGAEVRHTTSTHNLAGLPIETREFGRLVETNAYDDSGNLTSRTDALGRRTSWTYDRAGRVLTETSPAAQGDPGGYSATNLTQFTYDENGNLVYEYRPGFGYRFNTFDALNRLVQSSDSLGFTSVEFDNAGRPTATTDALGRITRATYDAAGQMTSRSLPGQLPTKFTYNADGQQVSERSPSGRFTSTTGYTTDGLVQSRTSPGGVATPSNANDFMTKLAYDKDGNLVSTTDATGRVWKSTWSPAGDQLTRTDALGKVTKLAYDTTGKLTAVTAPLGGRTAYVYDKFSNLTKRVDARGKASTYTYDAADQLVSVTDELGRKATYEYDLHGEVSKQISARARASANPDRLTLVYQRDVAGRLLSSGAASGDDLINYGYDDAGRLRSALRPDGSGATYDLDAAGQVIRFRDEVVDLSYSYDAAGRQLGRTGIAGADVSTAYDADGLPANLTSGGRDYSLSYDSDGRLRTIGYPASSGLSQTWGYDQLGRPTSIAATKSGQTAPLDAVGYKRDANGRVIAVTRTRESSVTTNAFAYNANGWLIKECRATASCTSASSTVSYGYDPNGNRVTEKRVGVPEPGSITRNFDAANQLKTEARQSGTQSFVYDADGRLTSGGRIWNVRGQMTASDVVGAQPTRFAYGTLGQRISKTTAGATTTFGWDGTSKVPALLSITTAAEVAVNDVGPGGRLLATTEAGAGELLLGDAQGSVTTAMSLEGELLDTSDYGAFGELIASPDGDETSPPAFGYTGALREPALGPDAYHLRARDYSANEGRFQAPDPIALDRSAIQATGYAYVTNDPLNLTDPSGLCAPAALGGAAVGGAIGGVAYALTAKDFSFKGLLASVAGGAVAGGIVAGTCGAAAAVGGGVGALAVGAGVGALSGMGGVTASTLVAEHRLPSASELLAAGASGAVLSSLGTGVGQLLKNNKIGAKCAKALQARVYGAWRRVAGSYAVGGSRPQGGLSPGDLGLPGRGLAVAEPGTWGTATEFMSSRSAAYQARVTGSAPGSVYSVGGVKFDGFAHGVLQEAKGPGYARFVRNGQFEPWFSGAYGLASQAQRQLAAAGGTPITWSVAEPEAATAISNLFKSRGIFGINVVYVP